MLWETNTHRRYRPLLKDALSRVDRWGVFVEGDGLVAPLSPPLWPGVCLYTTGAYELAVEGTAMGSSWRACAGLA